MAFETIAVETRGRAGLLTLNRPEKLNAWTPRMSEEMAQAIEAFNADDEVGAIVVTGAGRGFCAGADMDATFKTRIDGADPGADTAAGSGGMPAGLDWVGLCREAKPLVAAVNGAAVGIGMTMILPFDVILASERAKFGMFFVKVGLVPELASTHLLAQRVGMGRASEMCLTGGLYGPETVADRVVAADALLDTALGLAEDIAANPAPQLRMIKRLLTQNAAETDLGLVQERESEMLRECWRSPEHKAAVEAFLAKAGS